MKIGIEAQRIQRKKKHGMDIVALEYIQHLQQLDQENEYFIFMAPGEDTDVLQGSENVHLINIDAGPYPIWEQLHLPKACKKYGLDLLHCTSNTAPIYPGVPLISTVHDIIYLESLNLKKGTYYQRFGNLYRRWNVPRIMKNCRKIITVSEFESQNIKARFPELTDRVEVVYNAAGDHFKLLEDNVLSAFARKHKLPQEFIFFIGNTDPKKNVPNTLKAYALYRQNNSDALPLVMPDLDKDYLQFVMQDIGEPDLGAFIHLTGYIQNQELPKLYNLTSLFLYTSKRESFGIPLLEAFNCGVPVVGSSMSSIPEIAGNGAILCDPENPAEIAEAIASALNNERKRFELIRNGLERAKAFSWEQSARQLLKIYQEI